MKTILNTIKIDKKIFCSIFFIVLFTSYTEAQVSENAKSEISSKSPEKSSIPVFVNTGNQELDNKTYLEVKNAWIKANPEEYRKILNNKPIEVSKIEFDKMPNEKQNEIKNHPEKYILK